MSYKIQITVDKQLNKTIRESAKHMGLSVSSYARLVLTKLLLRKNNPLLNQALADINSNKIESLTLAAFNRQIDDL